MKPVAPLPDYVVVNAAEARQSNPEQGLTRLVGAYNEKLFLAEHRMEKGWVGLAHSHPHEQIVYVVSGHLKVTCAGETFYVRSADTFLVPAGVRHPASPPDPAQVIYASRPF